MTLLTDKERRNALKQNTIPKVEIFDSSESVSIDKSSKFMNYPS